jgi:nucleoid DNA-binding protein
MAATKRKTTIRSIARKAVKKPTARTQKKPVKAAAKVQKKAKVSSAKKTVTAAPAKVVRTAPITSVSKPFTKGQLFTTLAGRTGLQRKDVSAVFDELKTVISVHLKKQGPGQFTIPGLVKLTVANKPATKARKGTNPFTGEEMMFKAKPARNVVKARALKQLKEMV